LKTETGREAAKRAKDDRSSGPSSRVFADRPALGPRALRSEAAAHATPTVYNYTARVRAARIERLEPATTRKTRIQHRANAREILRPITRKGWFTRNFDDAI